MRNEKLKMVCIANTKQRLFGKEHAKTNYISIEAIEAMRLVDYENRSQIEAAAMMGVSRATIQRLCKKARQGLLSALLWENSVAVESKDQVQRRISCIPNCQCKYKKESVINDSTK